MSYLSSHILKYLEHSLEVWPGSHGNADLNVLLNVFRDPDLMLMCIEATWTLGTPPDFGLKTLTEGLSALSNVATDHDARIFIRKFLDVIQHLKDDLGVLSSCWAEVLMREPSEIWQPSISAFTKSPFWRATPGARIVTPPPKHSIPQESLVTLISRVSRDGTRVAALKIHPRFVVISAHLRRTIANIW